MVDVLEELGGQLDEVAGASDVKSGISSARRELRKDNPDMEKVMAELADAQAQYQTQAEWRRASAPLVGDLNAYEDGLRNTLGLNEQDKISREQALFVASWQKQACA